MISGPTKSGKIEVPSTLDYLKEATEGLLAFFGELPLSGTELFDIRLCFEESFINAIKYGNKGREDLSVKVEMAFNNKEIFVAVEDMGQGFDPKKLPDPTKEQNLEATKGRGVYIVRHIMDNVQYNDLGNRVEMVKLYNKSS